jgi:hypothetical protein
MEVKMIVILMAMGKSSAVAGRVTAGTTTRAIAACTQGNIDITVTASPISGPTFDIAGRDKNRYHDVSSIGGGGSSSSNNYELRHLFISRREISKH